MTEQTTPRPRRDRTALRRRFRAASTLAVVVVAFGLAACDPLPVPPGGPGVPAPSNGSTSSVSGQAFGLNATVTTPLTANVSVAPLALQGMPCNPASGSTATASVASGGLTVPLPVGSLSVVSSGTVVDTGKAVFDRTAQTADITESSTVQGLNLLNGLVTATAVQARAHTTKGTAGVDHHPTDGSTGATFTDLKIAGIGQPANPPANTRIDLPLGAGYVVLNEQTIIPPYFTTPERVSVDAIHVHIANVLGVSGDVRVAHAQTGLGTATGRLSGSAYVVGAAVQPLLATGALGLATMPCPGSGGQDITTDQVGVQLGPVGSVGVGRATVNGTIGANGPVSTTSATVAGVNLLDGAIKADAITARSSSSAGAAGAATDAAGSTFANLVIGGKPIAAAVPANTRIDLPGIGFVTLNEQLASATAHDASLYVSGLHLRVTVANSLGLPIGADVVIARANSSATS